MRTETAMARMRASLALCVLVAMGALAGCQISPQTSAFGEITAAQEAWGDGVAHIGQVWAQGGDYRQAAEDHVDALYGYGARAVLFKPTKAADQPFRLKIGRAHV